MAETTSDGPRPGRAGPDASAPGPARRELPVGAIVFAGALIALLSMGVRSVLPLWQTPLLQELGWSSFEFSVALATQNLMWGAFSPLFGALADRFGAWSSLLIGAMLQAAGLWVMSAASDPTAFFLSAGLMIGVAQSASGMGIVLGAVGRVVPERHRTMAFGLITSASSAGMIVVTPIGRALLETQGWADAFVGLAVLSLPMIALAFLMRTRRGHGGGGDAARITVGQALGEAARHRGYVLLVLGFFVCGFHVTFIGVHLPKYLNDIGLGWQLGATAMMIIGVFNVASCLAVGVVASAVSKKGVLAMIYIGRAVAIAAFVLAPPSEWSVYLFAAAIGVLWLSTVPPTQGIVAQVFGTQHMTMLFGIVFLGHQVGSFLGVTLGARAFDAFGSYDLVWYAAVALGILAAVCHLLIDEKPVTRTAAAPAPAPAE